MKKKPHGAIAGLVQQIKNNYMKIKEKLEILRDYYDKTRQVGHTTLVKEGTNNYKKPKLILVYKKDEHTYFDVKSDELISWKSLHNQDLLGQNKPLAIDNGVMWLMLDEAIKEINKLESHIK